MTRYYCALLIGTACAIATISLAAGNAEEWAVPGGSPGCAITCDSPLFPDRNDPRCAITCDPSGDPVPQPGPTQELPPLVGPLRVMVVPNNAVRIVPQASDTSLVVSPPSIHLTNPLQPVQ